MNSVHQGAPREGLIYGELWRTITNLNFEILFIINGFFELSRTMAND